MARPSTPINVLIETKKPHRSNEWIEQRKQNEEALKVGTDKIKPPSWLSARGKKIFKRVAEDLMSIDIISDLDIDTLAIYADSVDKYSKDSDEIKALRRDFNKFKKQCDDAEELMEKSIEVNKLIDRLIKGQLRLADNIRKYAVEFGLTPQARAKLAIPREEKKEETEFEKLFGDV